MQIDIYNIDQLIFQDKRLNKELSHFKALFDQWTLGIRIPALRFLAQKSRLELLENLNTPTNKAILEKYFNEKVDVQTIDYHIAQHHKVPIREAEVILNTMDNDWETNNVSVSRDAEYLYISIWR
jgi:hypothetical protein